MQDIKRKHNYNYLQMKTNFGDGAMKRYTAFIFALIILIPVFTGCSSKLYSGNEAVVNSGGAQAQPSGQVQSDETAVRSTSSAETTQAAQSSGKQENSATDEVINYSKIKPNECGQMMVVMFHNFVKEFGEKSNEYTTTFSEFEKLLNDLYDKKYRLINLTDMLDNNINVPAGCIPMVFTFDDGTAGQFNLLEKDGKLVVNPESAVGVMEAFNQKHPDFGLKGTFYVNLGVKTFSGSGDISDRLNYLISKGFEIGNHTKTHAFLPDIKTVQHMLEEVGGNQTLMNEIVPGYRFNSFALPFGNASKDLREYVIKGSYEGVEYKNSAILLVGANPSPSPVSVKFNPLSLPRVRSNGPKKVEYDLSWWLEELTKGSSQYISDGNPDTVTVPKEKKENVDMAKLNGKQLITY